MGRPGACEKGRDVACAWEVTANSYGCEKVSTGDVLLEGTANLNCKHGATTRYLPDCIVEIGAEPVERMAEVGKGYILEFVLGVARIRSVLAAQTT
jgi:hypothetical protein